MDCIRIISDVCLVTMRALKSVAQFMSGKLAQILRRQRPESNCEAGFEVLTAVAIMSTILLEMTLQA